MFENLLTPKSKDTLPLGCLEDEADERDFMAEHILGTIDPNFVYPDRVRMDIDEGNQGALDETKVACTCFASYHAAQAANEVEHDTRLFPDFVKGWSVQGHFGTRSSRGDYVRTALKSIVKNGLITKEGTYPVKEFAQIGKSPSEIRYWLAKGFAIVTSARTTSTNFRLAKTTGYWGGNDGAIRGGHAFALTGYENLDKDIVGSQSYGSKYGFFNDGSFRIRDEDIKHLGTCYIEYDVKDVKKIFTDVTEESWAAEALTWAKKNKIVKGYEDGSFKPNQPMTRAEMVQVMYNFKKKFR